MLGNRSEHEFVLQPEIHWATLAICVVERTFAQLSILLSRIFAGEDRGEGTNTGNVTPISKRSEIGLLVPTYSGALRD